MASSLMKVMFDVVVMVLCVVIMLQLVVTFNMHVVVTEACDKYLTF